MAQLKQTFAAILDCMKNRIQEKKVKHSSAINETQMLYLLKAMFAY